MPRMHSRAGTAAVLLAALLAGAGCSSSADSDGDSSAPAAAVLKPACPSPSATPTTTTITADRVNQVVSSTNLPAWQAADIGASGRLGDGRLVWVFGDTVRSGSFSPQIVANSMLISSGPCVSQLLVPGNGPVIPDVSHDVVQWPMSVVVLPPVGAAAGSDVRDLLVVLCARTQRGTGGDMDFAFLGTSAAVFTVAGDGVPQLQKVMEITPDNLDSDQVNWGAAVTVRGEWYYV